MSWSLHPREDDRLAEHRPYLCAADIEHITVPGNIGHVIINSIRGQRIAKTCAVDEQAQAVFLACRVERRQLLAAVDHAVFCRQGDVDHAWLYHVAACLVGKECVHIPCHISRPQLAVLPFKCYHLVAESLHSARFMHSDVSCLQGYDTLTPEEERVDDRRVGLCPTHEEEHVCPVIVYRLANSRFSLLTVHIAPISGCLHVVCLCQTLQNLRKHAVVIVALK